MADKRIAVVCGTAEEESSDADLSLHLHLDDETRVTSPDYVDRTGAVHTNIGDFTRQVGHLSDRTKDLLEIASFVHAADRLVHRGSLDSISYDPWSGRSFRFIIPVRDHTFWASPNVRGILGDVLEFVSGDRHHEFDFRRGRQSSATNLFDTERGQIRPSRACSVVLFSGGLDSLTGAVQRLNESDDEVRLVSHRAKGSRMKTIQDNLVEALERENSAERITHHVYECNLSSTIAREETQRTRSLLFGAIAYAVARALNLQQFYLYENGVTGINLPKRRDLLNARASRTTHPRTVDGLKSLFSEVAGEEFRIENPFLWKTKTDVVERLHNRYSCGHLHDSSVSCGGTRDLEGSAPQCGICSQCVDRRFASYAAGVDDRDERIPYGNDVIFEETEDPDARKMSLDFIRSAVKYSQAGDLRSFRKNWLSELSEVVPYLDESEQEAVQKVYDLHVRHGNQVRRALTRIRNEEDVFESPPEGSVLEMINSKDYLQQLPGRRASGLKSKLQSVPPGRSGWEEYEEVVQEVVSFLFEGNLVDPCVQVETNDRTQRVDLTYRNKGGHSFWDFVKHQYNAVYVVVEAKNTEELGSGDIDQAEGRLREDKTQFALVLARSCNNRTIERSRRSLNSGEAVIVLTDEDLIHMLDLRGKGESTSDYLENKLRELREKL